MRGQNMWLRTRRKLTIVIRDIVSDTPAAFDHVKNLKLILDMRLNFFVVNLIVFKLLILYIYQ